MSIHAPREGCDTETVDGLKADVAFQSTHPARGATARQMRNTTRNWNFNPRTPRGVRLCSCGVCLRIGLFQSTHPARGATMQMGTLQ